MYSDYRDCLSSIRSRSHSIAIGIASSRCTAMCTQCAVSPQLHIFSSLLQCSATFDSCRNVVCRRLWCECILTKRLELESRVFTVFFAQCFNVLLSLRRHSKKIRSSGASNYSSSILRRCISETASDRVTPQLTTCHISLWDFGLVQRSMIFSHQKQSNAYAVTNN